MKRGIVAIVGKPNVGKSSLFNRIIGEKKSIVYDEPGVTRDRIYALANWLTREFNIIDTGGIEIENRPFQESIRAQAEIAIDEADVIVFLCDGRSELSDDDYLIAKIIKKTNKPIILAVNKIDDISLSANAYEYYKLGINGDIVLVSTTHGIGIGDLLDKIVELLPKHDNYKAEDIINFSLIGRPNVGKSSLYNAILNEQRVIVSPLEGTTRDSIDTTFTRDGQKYTIIDTAGLRKKGKNYEAIDKYAALRALSAIDKSDVVLLVIDGAKGILEQDKSVVRYAVEEAKPLIIIVNKWDLVDKSVKSMNDYIKDLKDEYKFCSYATFMFVSALSKQRVGQITDEISRVYKNACKHIPTSIVNEIILDAFAYNNPPDFNGGRLKILYANQVASNPPTIILFVNNPDYMHFSYKRYLENKLRERIDFDGTPIKIICRPRD
ncbi:MAG: ribosome biogenesis GTPase Der [Erysipelotrichaceae bacterium]|nr:ribosome biogenesis GTPase Der [Erysipelotrichaceae bacterium]